MSTVKICGSRLWNASVSWETNHPSFSLCFQNFILVVASCAVLWIVAPFEFAKIFKTQINPSPWTRLAITKLVFKVILLQICTMDLATAVYSYVNDPAYGLDGIISALSYFLTIVLTVIITLMCKNRSIRVSLALPSFWMISTVANLVSIYNDILILDTDDWTSVVSLVDDGLTFFISLIQLMLSTFADHAVESQGRAPKENCPLQSSSLPSRLTFSWILSLLNKSKEKSLHQNHLISLCSEQKSTSVAQQFERICRSNFRNFSKALQDPENHLGITSDKQLQEENVEFHYSYPKGKSLFLIVLKISGTELAIASLMEIIYILIYFTPVYILSLILGKENVSRYWHYYVYSVALFLILLVTAFCNSQRKYFSLTAALKIRTAVINAAFTKVLKISQPTDKVKNLITVEADNIFQAVCIMSDIWGSPIRIVLGIYILWRIIGPSCFIGILAALFLIPLNIIVEYCASHFQKTADVKKKEKIDLLSECLNGMKTLKLYAWEEFFLTKLVGLRKTEISDLRKSSFLRMAFKFLLLSATSIIALATISAYILMENSIDVRKIFLSYFVVYMLKTPIQCILHLLAYFIEGIVSTKRVESFLQAKDLETIPTLRDSKENTVVLNNASFSWSGLNEACLKNLSISIPRGSLIAVVGDTKSGKSSLMRALLGEMQKVEGEASIEDQVAFVTQNSWIQNMTLEKNILFLKEKNDEFFTKTLEACALTSDMENLPAGEETEIGQKGIDLTLDQKLKVDLARAVYQNADLYIFDDPLRNLNTLLSEHLYHRVIGRSGLLKEKTRLFMTRTDEFLPLVDFILFLKEGRVIEKGTYSQLTGKNGHFSEYLKTCRSNSTTDEKSQLYLKRPDTDQNTFGKKNDLWCTTAASVKIELEPFHLNDELIAPKDLGSSLFDYFKILGYSLSTAVIVAGGLASFCEVTSGVWLSVWFDGYKDEYDNHRNLLVYAGIILSQIFLTITCGIALFSSSTLSSEKLHTWLLQQIMRASHTIFETTPIKRMINSFVVDFHYVDAKIPDTVYVWLLVVLKVPALLVIIFIVSPILAVALIPLVFGFLVIQQLYLASRQQLQHLTVATSCPLLNLLDDTLSGLSHIRSSRAAAHFFQRFRAKLDTHNNCFFLFLVISRWLSCVLDIIIALLVLVTTIFAFHEQEQGNGFIALAIVCALQLGETLTTIVYISSMLNADLTPLERIKSFSQMKQESEWEDPANQPPASWPNSGSVIVKNFSAGYGEGMYPTIHDINLSIKAGEKVAVVGKEESGIYSFLYSLFRLIEPLEGNIVIDNIDIQKLGLRDLRSKLAIIPQEAIVFKGSVRHNLDPGKIYTDDELNSALETVQLNSNFSFSSLDSIVDHHLSLEEKYLLSIARCLLKKPKIVIIDEQEPPDSRGRKLFQESTILSFSEQPLIDHNGRTLKFMSGEIVPEDFPSTSIQI